MRYEINSVASQNQASHLLITLLDVMERAGRAPTLLESLEVLFTAHWRALHRRLPFLVGHSPIALDGALFESCMSDALPSWRHPRPPPGCFHFLPLSTEMAERSSRKTAGQRLSII